ncbi:hypothetical protein Vadar_004672 [Vaccinium darrowii]|uniref:Uncharacterized protein n=1 Tax=Vaccinium darrowii TaxID=229202 RepID=A0ACB7YJR3_9ERIC|nr:hypothetical protein Vadar_004672 [Vaccinium darrowii]
MENHNRLKLSISRLLRSSSCGSCKSRTTSDVIAQPETLPETRHHYQLIDLFSPTPHPLPSIFKPKTLKTETFTTPKVPHPSPLLIPQNNDGRRCPPASPISPLVTFPRRKKLKKKRSKTRTAQLLKRGNSDSEDYDDENTTLFSSVSLSSDSSDSFRRNRANQEVDMPIRRECEVGLVPLKGKVKDSFVVKKRSSDPYDDFRKSMVEMIVERQIFGARDLEDLLQTFLSLNSYHHHRPPPQPPPTTTTTSTSSHHAPPPPTTPPPHLATTHHHHPPSPPPTTPTTNHHHRHHLTTTSSHHAPPPPTITATTHHHLHPPPQPPTTITATTPPPPLATTHHQLPPPHHHL